MDSLQVLEQEKKAITERWEKYGLLENITTEEKKSGTAVLLENQRLFNENSHGDNEAQFKRISIPLARRIAPNLAAWHFVSVQPLLLTQDHFYYFQGNKLVKEAIEAKQRKMKTTWNYDAVQDLRPVNGLNAEAELCAVLAQELAIEFDRHLIHELREGAAVKKFVDFNDLYGNSKFAKYITLQQVVADLAEDVRIYSKRGHPTWVCTSQEIAETISSEENGDDFFTRSLGIHKYGVLAENETAMTIWVDPIMKAGQLVMGYRGKHSYDAGYAFCPHLLLKRGVLDQESFVPRSPIISICGAAMTDPTCYAALEIENFIPAD